MGTRFELVLPEDNQPEHLRAIGEAALAEIDDCHRRLSRFDPASLVSYIVRSAGGAGVPLDRDTFALFQDTVTVWRASEGAFDITVPHQAMSALILDPVAGTIRVARPEIALDLGGIAKGHALELAARILRDHGVATGFLHGGTSSAIGLGSPPGQTGWRVALAGGGEVELHNSALSVSATWDGNPHPTRDPRTGVALAGPRRAVVTGPNARLADAWSTAVLVLGARPDGMGAEWTVSFTGAA
jgi:FAD:protein FMN transferase